jgi:protein-tyrosine phosphatase
VNDVFWIKGDPPAPLAIVLCPRGGPGLRASLLQYQRAGVETLVSLLEEQQVGWLGLDQEGCLAEEIGMQFLWFPLPDHDTPPDLPAFRAFVASLANRLRAGERIGVHCWGSIGRATVTSACTLIHLGWHPTAALAAAEATRGCEVPDTEEQQNWILRYKAQP